MATEAVNAAAEAAGTAEKALFPPFDPQFFASQLFWLAITFVIFYFVMKRVAIPQIGNIIAERQDRIAADLGRAERLKSETDDAMAAYEQALTEARGRAYKIAEQANERASREAAAQRAATEAELSKKLEAAEQRIADIKSRALSEVGMIATETAEAVLARLVGPGVDKREVSEAVAATLAGTGAANA